jgi:ABC-type transport system involved in multi-copper enzyme maturation permease subunit
LKEAIRRRALVLSLMVMMLLCAGLFVPITGRLLILPPNEAKKIIATLYILFATDIVKFFASVFAIALGAGAIGAELDKGVLATLLPKPLPRFSFYAGKWLGLFIFTGGNVCLWMLTIWVVATYRAPEMSHRVVFGMLPYVLLYPMVFLTISLLFSTMASFPLAAGLSILAAGMGWSEGILYFLAKTFSIEVLKGYSNIAGFLVPLGRMARWVEHGYGPPPKLLGQTMGASGPFRDFVTSPMDLVYIGGYVVVLFVLGAIIFGRRDV